MKRKNLAMAANQAVENHRKPVEESMPFTESQIAPFTLTEDAKEGQKAFQEKRKLVWAGQ